MFWWIILIIIGSLAALMTLLYLIGLLMKPATIYKNRPDLQNPMEGKLVRFAQNDLDKENADGVKGHLEVVGECPQNNSSYRFAKRFFDISLSFLGLLILSPVFLAISLAIIIDDPGPVFFTQRRVGQNKQYFKLHKFRSMRMSTPHNVPTHMLENPEQYITKVGKFLRAHSLDELPQIWDIFIGNMSIIGPRPALWNQDLLVAKRDEYGAGKVKPGLTGWAQINGRDELKIDEKAKLDGEYAEKYGFKFDLKCFFRSIHVFGKDETVVEGCNRQKEQGKTEPVISLKDKKILLLSPAFFNYEEKIKKAMESMGAYVVLHDERSVSSPFQRALLKINPKIFRKKTIKYYKNICDKHGEAFDYILIVKSDMVSPEIIKMFREKYPSAKICLHIWDSVKNIRGIMSMIPLYDYCSSFDRFDCMKVESLHFRPLFFTSEFEKSTSKGNYDLCFCGTMHSDRYYIVNKIANQMNEKGKTFYKFMYLQSKFIFYYYKIMGKGCRKIKQSDFSLKKLTHREVAEIERDSKVILDIQHPNQNGLTMRTIEMVGMGKKFITTNKDIVNYDFYNKNNIMIVDRDNPVIDYSFFEKEYEEIPEDIYENYRITKWIKDVLGGLQ